MKICTEPNFLRILLYIKIIVEIIKVGACLILIIMGMINLGKAVIGNDDEIKKAMKKFVSQMEMAAIVFLIPTIMNMLLFTDNIITDSLGSFSTCTKNMTIKKIEALEKAQEDGQKKTADKYKHEATDNSDVLSGDSSDSAGDTKSDIVKFIRMWESISPEKCDSTHYKSYKHDSAMTVGYGVTKNAYDKLDNKTEGKCYPISEVDAAELTVINAKLGLVKTACQKVKVDCNDNQLAALADIGYNFGGIGVDQYVEILKAYKSGRKAGLIEIIQSKYINYGKRRDTICSGCEGQSCTGLLKRRDAEIEMFIEGYTDKVSKGNSISLNDLKYVKMPSCSGGSTT